MQDLVDVEMPSKLRGEGWLYEDQKFVSLPEEKLFSNEGTKISFSSSIMMLLSECYLTSLLEPHDVSMLRLGEQFSIILSSR